MAVPAHAHPELEDRVTLEVGALRGDIAALDGRVRQGFAGVVQVLQNHGEHLRRQGDLLAQILERLDRQNGGDDG
jgi:hypothetical protein